MTTTPPADQSARDRIHHDLDATVFVEAGAGTGKTRELIERILRLVATGRTELRQIAAITFTEAAAAELRDRVRVKLEEAAQDGSALPPEERDRCRAALAEVDAAAIETLHAFAQRILAAHPLEAGLPPLIERQDDIAASIAFEERWAAFVDELLDDPALEDVLLRAFTLGLTPDRLRGAAQQFHQHWDRLESATIEAEPLPPLDVAPLAARLDEACHVMANCLDATDLLYQHLERVATYRRRLASAESELDRLRILAEGTRIQPGRGGRAPNWHGVSPAQVREQLSQAHELREGLLQQARASVLPPLLAALRRFILDYADDRRRQGRLEFHDLLVQARDLLRRDASVRRAVQEQFSHLLIDEFHDTDPLQIEIATLIAGEETDGIPPPWHEMPIEEGRLFFVGDPKQSIYRFRRADIDLYQAVQRRFADQTVWLTQNFRSLQPVIDWVNHAFAELMGEGASDGQAAYVPLHASREPDGAGMTVRLLGGPGAGNIGLIREREAREIARLIQAAKADDWPVVEEDSNGQRHSRPARYQDIAILMPTRTTLPPIEEALEQAGIPYRVESRSLVYDTQEVRDLLAILRAADDPTDEVALVAALRSPAFGCGDDDLLRFVQAGGSWDYRREPPSSLPPDDPVAAAMAALHDLHRRRSWETISGIVEAVIRERRLFELAFAHRRPRERWQRLRFVLDQARAFAEAGGSTLRQFIDWAERQAEEGTQVVETVVPEPDDDAVRIMTIHASKGLEFPIVVLAGLNIDSASREQRRATILWGGDGRLEASIGPQSARFETPGYADLAAHERIMDQHEKVRLLYVAATRARDHLLVSLHHKAGSESHAARLYECSAQAPHLWRSAETPEAPPAAPEGPEPVLFDDGPERRRTWLETRRQRLEALARVRTMAATEIARSAAGAPEDPNLQKDPPVEETPPWKRGRAGTALGRAVHAVLQSIDLATGAGVESAARAQAAAEGIADRADEVARMVRAALDAPSVREAIAGEGRYWRELYVAAPVDGVTVEGFVDLLYETPDGLVVVDYKTDVVPSEAELEAAMARYRLQGAAYALALQEALGRPVARCVFVFVRPSGAREREIEDLPAAIDAVREELRRHNAPVPASGDSGIIAP